MDVLKKLLMIVGGIVVLFISTSFVIPKEYSVERRININASPEEVYPYIVDLKEWQKWGVWFKRDPQMTLDYAGPDRAIGMRSEWKSETEGNGEMEITELEHNKRVVYRLYFPEMDMGSTGSMELRSVSDGTQVTWRDEGSVDNNPVNKFFVLFIDKLIGPDFEMGLENLKTLVENKS